MMATFMFVMVPRAEACAERIEEVLDTASSVMPPADPVSIPRSRGPARVERRRVPLPGRRRAGAARHRARGQPRRGHRRHRQHRRGQDDAAQPVPRLFDVTAGSVRIDGIDVREIDEDSSPA